MKRALKLLLHSLLGFLALLLFNVVGGFFGMAVGLNALNACVIGTMGVPGFALLLVLQTLSV